MKTDRAAMGRDGTTVSTEEMQFLGISSPSRPSAAASRTWGLNSEERQSSVLYCVVDGRIIIPQSGPSLSTCPVLMAL